MKLEEVIRIAREVAFHRLINSELSISLGTLSAVDIVAILLAFFAIALSAAFYFKGSEASSKFYDNMHKFTQDTSVILGKIESKFGEQLRNIEERSVDLKASVEKYYTNKYSEITSEIQIDKEITEREVDETKQQYSKLIEQIFSEVHLDSEEKESLKESLKAKENEIERLQKQLAEASNAIEKELEPRVKRYLERRIRKIIGSDNNDRLTPKELYLKILESSVVAFRRDILKIGYITDLNPRSESDITDKGFDIFMSALDSALSDAD